MTRAEYTVAIEAMDARPILGEHVIGVVKVMVGPRKWTVEAPGENVYKGDVRSGPMTRHKIKMALYTWLSSSGIR